MIKGAKDYNNTSGFRIGEKFDLFKITGTKRPAPKKDGGKDNKPTEKSK